MVNLLEPFKYFISVSEVKFDLGSQRSYFGKGPWLKKGGSTYFDFFDVDSRLRSP